MPYRMMGRIHCRALRAAAREDGQGTVEYVGIMLLLGTVLAAAVAGVAKTDTSLSSKITGAVKDAIDGVTKRK
jgi:hypothetical protein